MTRPEPTQWEPTPQPIQPSTVLAEPATVDACRADYDQGTGDRTAMDKNLRR
jgi:hypothetical protein